MVRQFISIVFLLLAPSLIITTIGCSSDACKHYDAGVELHEQGCLQDAITEYDEAIRLNPDYADAYYKRGCAYCDLGQLERSIEDYNEAIRLDPKHAYAYHNRALAYYNLGQLGQAIEDYDEAIRLNPQQEDPSYIYSWAVDTRGDQGPKLVVEHEIDWVKSESNPIISLGGVGEWDEKVVYSMAVPANISNGQPVKQDSDYWIFYSGAGDTKSQNHETSIGLAISGDVEAPSKYGSNPVINRSAVNLSGNSQGISVFDIKLIESKYYMFLMANYSDTDFRIAMMESTDLLTWSNFTVVLSDNYKDHCPYIIEDPDDASRLIMYFAYIPSEGEVFRIGRATADKTSPYTWTYDLENNPILYNEGKNILYPFVEYSEGTYTMYFGKYPETGYFRIYETSNTVGTSFPDSDTVLVNYGESETWDDSYVSVPRKYISGNHEWIYYAARASGSNVYTGIGLVHNWETSP